MTTPQRPPAAALARPGIPGPRPVGRPMSAAAMARPIAPAHPAAMPVGRPVVPAPRAAVALVPGPRRPVALPGRRRGRLDDAGLEDDRVPPRPRRRALRRPRRPFLPRP